MKIASVQKHPTRKKLEIVLATCIFPMLCVDLTCTSLAAIEPDSERLSPASPQWIWGSRGEPLLRARTTWHFEGTAEFAELTMAVDFCNAVVRLNGHIVADVDDRRRLQQRDVKPRLKQGNNVLSVDATRTDGPAAIAVELHMKSSDKRSIQIQSSRDWLSETQLVEYGSLRDEVWWSLKESPAVSAFDEYNQWKEALDDASHSEMASFQMPAGFVIERLFQANTEDGSFVSLEIDDRGRFLLGSEDKGVLRLTIETSTSRPGRQHVSTKWINHELRGVHGLLRTSDGIVASANRSQGLYLLSNPKTDNEFHAKLLRRTSGGTGDHGRHDVVQNNQGNLFLVHGDSIEIPADVQCDVPITDEFDQVPKGGHVIQTTITGKPWRIFCSGLRNPYGLALNREGELFTYDADAERHTGLPWYRPTRILHLVRGADYGWRNPENPWPEYLPDSLHSIAQIGRGSPTSLKFGYASSFPSPYRDALFALDWSYGRILAIHLVAHGASYAAYPELFVRGRPFSVCDLEFHDGAMYVLTGGRNTKSSLYRIRYVGEQTESSVPSPQMLDRDRFSQSQRELRRRLESYFYSSDPTAISTAWRFLGHSDPHVAHAARTILEHHSIEQWPSVDADSHVETVLSAILAMARLQPQRLRDTLLPKLRQLKLENAATRHRSMAVRAVSLVISADQSRASDPSTDVSTSHSICQLFDSMYPSGHRTLDRELCRLLVQHGSTNVVEKTLRLLAEPMDQVDQFHYLVTLSAASSGWNEDRRIAYFSMLAGAKLFQTDEGMGKILDNAFRSAIKQVPPDRRKVYAKQYDLSAKNDDFDAKLAPREFIRRWTSRDATMELESLNHNANVDAGRSVFREATCAQCHRKGSLGKSLGPDLTTVASRFGRRHLLEEIMHPSKTIASPYRNHVVELKGGEVITGRVIWNGFRKSTLHIASDPTNLESHTVIDKREIETHQESPISPMPERLLDRFSIEEIADLLVFLESDGP